MPVGKTQSDTGNRTRGAWVKTKRVTYYPISDVKKKKEIKVGFEPTNPKEEILSLPRLTTPQPDLFFSTPYLKFKIFET
jgi:hypothetical protein